MKAYISLPFINKVKILNF